LNQSQIDGIHGKSPTVVLGRKFWF